jgi:N-acetylglutamate synthase-like GNAT family acetyltransferase
MAGDEAVKHNMEWKVERIDLDDEASFAEISEFCTEAGLPFFKPVMKNLKAQFAIRDEKGELAAAGRLEWTYEHPMVEEIAVRRDLRCKGLGRMIVNAIIDEAVKRGITTIWVMAREPELFKKIGFSPAPETELLSKLHEECIVCRDYISVCNPILMKKRIG